MVLEARNDVVGGNFLSRFMVGELINGNHLPLMREHHDPEQIRCGDFHGIRESPS